jgi:hypothetical protein
MRISGTKQQKMTLNETLKGNALSYLKELIVNGTVNVNIENLQVNAINQTGVGNMTASILTPSGNLTNKSTVLITNTT